jgi:hypothetical protein
MRIILSIYNIKGWIVDTSHTSTTLFTNPDLERGIYKIPWDVFEASPVQNKGQYKIYGSFNDEKNVIFTKVWRYITVEDKSSNPML